MDPFQKYSKEYDNWFETDRGRLIFRHEVACLVDLIGSATEGCLEVGVGTGRFARALNIKKGIDPALKMLQKATGRGIQCCVGNGENLPFRNESFSGVIMVVTICFLEHPPKTLTECYRVLQSPGKLTLGLVPRNSPWGRLYMEKSRQSHRFYSAARFYTSEQVVELAEQAGFNLESAVSGLLSPPGQQVSAFKRKSGFVSNAGFVAMRFGK